MKEESASEREPVSGLSHFFDGPFSFITCSGDQHQCKYWWVSLKETKIFVVFGIHG